MRFYITNTYVHVEHQNAFTTATSASELLMLWWKDLLRGKKALEATSGIDLNDFSILSQNLIVCVGPTDASQGG